MLSVVEVIKNKINTNQKTTLNMKKSIIFLFSLLIISCTGTTEVKEPNMDYGGWSGVSDDVQ